MATWLTKIEQVLSLPSSCQPLSSTAAHRDQALLPAVRSSRGESGRDLRRDVQPELPLARLEPRDGYEAKLTPVTAAQ